MTPPHDTSATRQLGNTSLPPANETGGRRDIAGTLLGGAQIDRGNIGADAVPLCPCESKKTTETVSVIREHSSLSQNASRHTAISSDITFLMCPPLFKQLNSSSRTRHKSSR